MGVSPGDPRANITPQRDRNDSPDGQRNGDAKVEGSQCNETSVAAVGQVASSGEEIPELLSPLHEGTDGKDWK